MNSQTIEEYILKAEPLGASGLMVKISDLQEYKKAIDDLKEENEKLSQCIEKNWGKSGADILKEKDDHEEWRLKLASENHKLARENETLQNQYDMAIQVDNKEIACLKEEIEELQDEIAENEEKQKEAWTMGYEERGEELKRQAEIDAMRSVRKQLDLRAEAIVELEAENEKLKKSLDECETSGWRRDEIYANACRDECLIRSLGRQLGEKDAAIVRLKKDLKERDS